MAIPHPIPYQGSKRNLASKILEYIPQDTVCLIEPFAGSAALSLAVASYNKAEQFIINDINAPLMSLWTQILNHPEQLAKYYQQLWFAQLGRERQFYDYVRERFNIMQRPHYFLYLLARCVKAAVRYNANGEFNQSPDNRRKGRKPETMRRDILEASHLLHGKTRTLSTNYEAILHLATENDVIYMDPPYQGVSTSNDSRYISGLDHKLFIQQLQELNKRNISYLVSYDGRSGKKHYGKSLPSSLQLECLELEAGRSSQATLLGKKERTVESLYLSPALLNRLDLSQTQMPKQLSLFGESA